MTYFLLEFISQSNYQSFVEVCVNADDVKSIFNIQEDACSTTKTTNCKASGDVADGLVSIVESSSVISIPEDVSLVSDIINNLADNIGVVKTKNETDKV